MELLSPVPESEGMAEFRPSVPVLQLQESTSTYGTNDAAPPLRRITDPLPSSPLSPHWSSASTSYRTRNTSPYSRGHLRSKSSTSTQMARAQSMPRFNTAGNLHMSPQLSPQPRPASPSSPRGSPSGRIRIPRRQPDEVFPGLGLPNLPSRTLPGISEAEPMIYDEEIAPKVAPERCISPILGLSSSNTFPRIGRPASPLRYVSQPGSNNSTTPTTPTSLGSSPSFSSATRFGDYSGQFSYPGSFTSSSVPSTPTSARSRSPSISSLETIPDSPDAEEAALEADRVSQVKATAELEEGEDSRAKNVSESSGGRGRSVSVGFARDKRKRWSVCGAERRGDLNLDTIWED